jgi:hypothetical protein
VAGRTYCAHHHVSPRARARGGHGLTMDEVVAELAERAITGGLPDIHEPSVVGALRRYVEQLVGDDWTSTELAKQQAWAVENSDPYLQITLGHKPVNGNHLVALLCAGRLWETDPDGWLGGVPTAVKADDERRC